MGPGWGSRDQEAEQRLPRGPGDRKEEELEQFTGYGPQHLEKNTWKRKDGVLTSHPKRLPGRGTKYCSGQRWFNRLSAPADLGAPVLGWGAQERWDQSKAGPPVPHPFTSAHLLIPSPGRRDEARREGANRKPN